MQEVPVLVVLAVGLVAEAVLVPGLVLVLERGLEPVPELGHGLWLGEVELRMYIWALGALLWWVGVCWQWTDG